ncbi:MAG: YjbH domain-containing protein [Nitrospirae bacterium]|nr:YjbH domain-containing protein [Nitrospirota bacterium]
MKKNLLFLFLFLAVTAHAGYAAGFDLKGLQPLAPYGVFSTFGAESLKQGRFGIQLGFEKSRQPDYYRFTNQFAYGITDNIEFDLTLPYVLNENRSGDGFEDLSLGIKHRFFEEGKYGPSIAYIISASLNSGKSGFSTEGSIGGGIILTKRVGPVTGHVNVLYFRPGTDKFTDDITFAAGLDFAAAHNFKILAELYAKKSYSGKVDRLEARFGYRILTAENLYTTLGAGFDLKNRSPEYRLLLSLTYLFPPEKKKIKKIFEQEE